MQRTWPDLIIDGAIGDFACQVSRHPWNANIACLICMFRPPAGEAAEYVASRVTGLDPGRTQEAQDTVKETDVRVAPPPKQEWLRARLGHQICSVIEEGLAEQRSTSQVPEGFSHLFPSWRVSVPA